MTTQPSPDPNPDAASPAPEDPMVAIGEVSARLLAGVVSKRTMEALRRTVEASPSEYPWQVVGQVVRQEPVEPQDLAQRALRAQRDWILRGGRETPGKPIGLQAKTLLAKLVAQSIFLVFFTVAVVALLLLLKHQWPGADIYALLEWGKGLLAKLVPK